MDIPVAPAGAAPTQTIPVAEFMTDPGRQFSHTLESAETLLRYAAEEGSIIPAEVIGAIVTARIRYGSSGFSKADLVAFYSALTILASLLRPVTAASIKACESGKTRRKLRKDRTFAVILTVVTLLLSGISFINSAFVTQISTDLIAADPLIVSLRDAIGKKVSVATTVNSCSLRNKSGGNSSPGTTADAQLQDFARLSREIYKQALKVDFFIMQWESDPFQATVLKKPTYNSKDLELNPALSDFQAEFMCKTLMYQEVRDFAKNVTLDNTYIYGALALYLLPVLYALVGAYAFRLRSFSETVRRRSYHPSFADSARMIGAFIVGSVISLFNIFSHTVSLSPLAVAFLAGYAVEVFFAFLDALVKTFSLQEGLPRMPGSVTFMHPVSDHVGSPVGGGPVGGGPGPSAGKKLLFEPAE